MKKDYTEAQALRDKGLTLVEIARRTGINRDTISRNTIKPVKKKKVNLTKVGNQDVLNKGVAKVKPGLKKYDNIENRDAGARKVRVNRNTWIYTRCETDEEAIQKFNERHGVL